MNKTEKLNLSVFTIDDDAEETLVGIAHNFEIIDENFDETIVNILSHLKVGDTYQAGKRLWNANPELDGNIGWVNLRTGVFAPSWKKQTAYNIGDKIMSIDNNGHYYECIAGGISGVNEPVLPTIANGTVQDLYGFTIWQPSYSYSVDDIVVSTVGDKSYYYKCISSGTSGTTEPSWTNVTGSTVVDGTVEWYTYKTVIWQEKGVSCEFVKFGKVGDTITKLGSVTEGEWNAGTISLEFGGTGAKNSTDARLNLGATGKYSQNIGDNVARTFTINHNLNTRDVIVSVRENSSGYSVIQPDSIKCPDDNNIIVEFSVAPTINQYKVTVVG